MRTAEEERLRDDLAREAERVNWHFGELGVLLYDHQQALRDARGALQPGLLPETYADASRALGALLDAAAEVLHTLEVTRQAHEQLRHRLQAAIAARKRGAPPAAAV